MTRKTLGWLLSMGLLGSAVVCTTSGCGDKKTEAKKEDDDGEKKKKKKKKQDEEPKKKDKPVVTATMGSEKFELKHAYVASEGTSAMVLQLSEKELKCDDVKPSGFSMGDDKLVSLTLAHKLMPSGKREWVIARGSGYKFAEKTLRDDRKKEGKISVTSADPEKGLVGNLDIELSHKDAKEPLVIKGDVEATGCGVKKPRKEAPADNPQGELTLTIAGEKITVKGAKLTLEKDRKVLDFTTAPQDCSYNSAGEFGLSLGLKDKGGMHAFLRGDAIQGNLNKSGDLEVEVKMGAKKDDKQEVDVKGSFEMFDYKVELSGKATPIVCEKK